MMILLMDIPIPNVAKQFIQTFQFTSFDFKFLTDLGINWMKIDMKDVVDTTDLKTNPYTALSNVDITSYHLLFNNIYLVAFTLFSIGVLGLVKVAQVIFTSIFSKSALARWLNSIGAREVYFKLWMGSSMFLMLGSIAEILPFIKGNRTSFKQMHSHE